MMTRALAAGKHVYGQKPLVHQLDELRLIREVLAKRPELYTQMGNQRACFPGRMQAVEILKSGQLGHLGLDVYEEEADLFFEDRSADVLQDDVLARLLSFPNVIVTAHQAFFTREALAGIADTTLANVAAWAAGAPVNVVQA